MFERALSGVDGRDRSALLAVAGITSWGACLSSLAFGWRAGLTWLAIGAVVFAVVRRGVAPTRSAPGRVGSAPDPVTFDPARAEARVLARLGAEPGTGPAPTQGETGLD